MKQKLLNYQPFNEQEEKDKELLLKVIEQKYNRTLHCFLLGFKSKS